VKGLTSLFAFEARSPCSPPTRYESFGFLGTERRVLGLGLLLAMMLLDCGAFGSAV
jgi:hypothetical protein